MTRFEFLSREYVADAGFHRGAWLQLIIFFLATALFAAAIFLLAPITVQAAGVHGPFNETTEKCEKCHAMHSGATQTLLEKNSVSDLCQSCHSGGMGADTAVMQGNLMNAATPGGTDYQVVGTLLGGGFDTMNSNDTTSTHRINELGMPFGTTETGPAIELTCTSCHTPHQGPNYRLLRRWVDGSEIDYLVTWNGPRVLPDGTEDYNYAEEDMDPATPGTQYFCYNYKAGLSAWCSGCHTRYSNRVDDVAYDAGDSEGAKVRYRHAVDVPVIGRTNIFTGAVYNLPTDLPLQDVNNDGRTNDDTIFCLTCHKAHGTDATMGAGIDSQASVRGSLPTDSILLRMNDRQICQIACHKVVN